MRKFLVLAAAAISCLAASSASAEYGKYTYHYCYADEGDTYFFSEIFTLRIGTWDKGAENSFHSFISGRFAEGTLDSWQCMGPYQTATEADDKMNDHIGDRRYNNYRVVLTDWRYSGD